MAGRADSVLDLMGDAPLVRLNRLPGKGSATVWAKLEMTNPMSFVKNRICLAMIEAAMKIVHKDEDLKRFYLRVKRRSGFRRARVAVARKLAEICLDSSAWGCPPNFPGSLSPFQAAHRPQGRYSGRRRAAVPASWTSNRREGRPGMNLAAPRHYFTKCRMSRMSSRSCSGFAEPDGSS